MSMNIDLYYFDFTAHMLDFGGGGVNILDFGGGGVMTPKTPPRDNLSGGEKTDTKSNSKNILQKVCEKCVLNFGYL